MAATDKPDTADYDGVVAMAKRLGLKGEERQDYIHTHMTGLGYEAKPNYVKRKGKDDGRNSSGWGRFSGGSRRQDDDDDDDDDI
jgi:hypothetical protein